jgi:hypothetical protein
MGVPTKFQYRSLTTVDLLIWPYASLYKKYSDDLNTGNLESRQINVKMLNV